MSTARAKQVVRVTILGEGYQIRSDVSADHTRAVAKYLDDAIRGVMGNALAVDSARASILAALQITGELFQLRQSAAASTEALTTLGEEMRRLLPPAKRGDGAAAPKRASATSPDGLPDGSSERTSGG